MFYSVLKIILRILFKIFLRLEVKGTENIPKTGPLVIASNHLSLLDPPVIGVAATRKVHFMAKQELFVPVLGTIYKQLGAFPVKRGGADRGCHQAWYRPVLDGGRFGHPSGGNAQ